MQIEELTSEMNTEPVLVTATYECGHTVNFLSPGVSDPIGIHKKLLKETGKGPVLSQLCWACDQNAAYLRQVPPETTEALRKAKKGE